MSDIRTLGDVLDYELLLEAELDSSSTDDGMRDWFRTYKGSLKSGRILYAWLSYRRGLNQTLLPGATVNRLYRMTSALLAVIGLLAGAGMGWGVLSYAGNNPVNLFMAIAVLVGIPFLLTSVSLILTLLPQNGDGSRRFADRLMRFFRVTVDISRRLGMVDRAHSDTVISGLNHFRGRSILYRRLIRWSVSPPIQLRALCFHLGIFIAVLWRGIVQDLAFAWQTTLNVSPEGIHRLIVSISWPWRMLITPPTAEQVAGSRIVLKEGISSLNNADLISWWPFICCAVLAYGVLPRLLLLIYGLLRRQLALVNLPFKDSKSHRLLMLMKAPRVDFTGTEPAGEHDDSTVPDSIPISMHKSMTIEVLVPSYREDLMTEESWKNYLKQQWDADFQGVTTVNLDDEDDGEILESLKDRLSDGDGILLVFEGWRPYTTGAGLYLEYLQSIMPAGLTVITALAGRPGSGFNLNEQDKESVKQWKRMLSAEVVELREW